MCGKLGQAMSLEDLTLTPGNILNLFSNHFIKLKNESVSDTFNKHERLPEDSEVMFLPCWGTCSDLIR